MKNPFACQREHLADYVTSEERIARLDKLRDSAMRNWEGALMWGGGNYLERVYAPMVTGLIDVATLAEELAEHPGNDALRTHLRLRLRDYFRDLDSAKAAQAMEGRWREERKAAEESKRSIEADRAAVLRDNVR